MIDTHCHLEACDPPRDELVAHATDAGVTRLLAIGMTNESCKQALAAADEYESVFVSVGRHPHESGDWDEHGLAALRELAAHPKVRAIGETGLDYKRDYAPRDAQRRAFIDQMALARELDKPIVIHTREAASDTLELLADHAGNQPVIIHCFSLSGELDTCIERGYYCSFAGNVTYPKAVELHEAAKRVPGELLLVETDSPYLTPQRWRSKQNEPAKVTATAEFLAELRETSYEQLEELVGQNSKRLFGW